MKKTFFVIVINIIFAPLINAQDLSFEWAKPIGSGANSIQQPLSITTDINGNVYTTGYFEGIVDFDPGSGITNLTTAGWRDIFIQKLDTNGNLLWVKQMGGTNRDEANSITTDINGYIYITGSFYGTADFDPGVGITNLTSAGNDDIFIIKLDTNGNLIWVKQMGGQWTEYTSSIITETDGNIYTIGYFYSTMDFDPGVGINILTPAGTGALFIQKLDVNGNLIWVKQIDGRAYPNSITLDKNGYIYTNGNFEGTTDFDPEVGITNLTSTGASDIFVQKLDTNGNLMWVKQMGGTSDDRVESIITDANGNVYNVGYFEDTADFDPGPGITNLTTSSSYMTNSFIQKLDTNGNLMWVKQITGGSNKINAMTIDRNGNVSTTGYFSGIADFDPGPGITNLLSKGINDIFIQRLDTSGNLIWVKQMGGKTSDETSSITTDINGNLYTTGFFNHTVDFDPGPGVSSLTSISGLFLPDAFVQKLKCNTTTATDTIIACNTYTWIDGNTYTNSNNTATHILTNASGCDSIVTLDLTINYPSTKSHTVTTCNSYTWTDGNTYTNSNHTATHTLTNVTGCDSVVTLDLTINYSSTETDTITACNAYTWIDGITYTNSNHTATHTLTNVTGCDSVVTLKLVIIPSNSTTIYATINKGESFTVGTSTYTTDGTYLDTLISSNNCDSIVTTNLTTIAIIDGINLTLTSNLLEIYPNPFDQFITVKSNKKIPTQIFIQITDLLGKEIIGGNYQLLNDEIKIDGNNLASGTYLLHIENIGTTKIIKK